MTPFSLQGACCRPQGLCPRRGEPGALGPLRPRALEGIDSPVPLFGPSLFEDWVGLRRL